MTRSFDKLKFLARLRNGVDLKRLLSLARKVNQRLSRQHRWRFFNPVGHQPPLGNGASAACGDSPCTRRSCF